MIVLNILLLLGFCVLLIKAVELLAASLQQLSKLTGVGKLAVSFLLMAVATSMPELVVSVAAAIKGNSAMALGTVLGSNIADISLVIGGAAFLGGSFSVAGEWRRLDLLSVFLAGAMPLILITDGRLGRSDGLILLIIYGLYNATLLKRYRRDDRGGGKASGLLRRMMMKGKKELGRWFLWLILGTAMLLISAKMVVQLGTSIAQGLGVPVFLIGLFLVAIGTSLPELAFEIEAIKKKQAGLALGDLFGSVVANSTLILGLTSLINPIKLENGLKEYLLAAAVFGGMFLLLWRLVATKKKLERWEGMVLIVAYAVFVMLEWGK